MKKVIVFVMVLLGMLLATYGFAVEKEALVCPVMGDEINPQYAVKHEYKGNTYVFCCQDCVAKFKANPEQYIGKALQPLSGEIINGVREIKVVAKKFEFIPDPIGVKQGEKVRLKIIATDVDHGFGIKEYKINQNLPVGKEQIVEFMADKAGMFTVKCTVFCGSGHGNMKGRLIVQPQQKKMNMPEHSGMGQSHKM